MVTKRAWAETKQTLRFPGETSPKETRLRRNAWRFEQHFSFPERWYEKGEPLDNSVLQEPEEYFQRLTAAIWKSTADLTAWRKNYWESHPVAATPYAVQLHAVEEILRHFQAGHLTGDIWKQWTHVCIQSYKLSEGG